MCDPITIGLAVAGAGAGLLATSSKPPNAAMPAPEAGKSITEAPVVKVGTKDNKTTTQAPVTYNQFTETRASGRPIGGLGRSGLAL